MKRSLPLFWFLSLGLCLIATDTVRAQQTKSQQLVRLFRDVAAKPSRSTVRVLVAGKEAALGTIVSADGWILTKHSVLKGDDITCRLADGKELAAERAGFDESFDLELLRVEANDLTPVQWTDSKAARVGHWVVSVGIDQDPVAIGVLSVAARQVKGAKYFSPSGSQGGYLGVALDFDFAGVKIQEVLPDTPAQRAGLKSGDHVLEVNGLEVQDPEEFRALLTRNKPGTEVKLKITRAAEAQELKVALGQAPGGKGGKSRSDIQNNMGSKLSERRAGFPIILQHDSVVRPNDCGGPLVNLDGKVLGINIARAGRVESYAIPSEAVRPLVEKLKKGKT